MVGRMKTWDEEGGEGGREGGTGREGWNPQPGLAQFKVDAPRKCGDDGGGRTRRAGGEASSTPASASTPPPSSLTLHVRAANFRTLAAELAESGCDAADGILLDLGFSSMQV